MTVQSQRGRLSTQADRDQWDGFVAAHPHGHLLQTSAWGKLKADFGWQPSLVTVSDAHGQITAGAQVLYRSVRRGFPITLGYIPAGPLFATDVVSDRLLWQALDRDARRHGAIALKVEPCDWYAPQPGLVDRLTAAGLRPNAPTVQPPRTIVLDLSADEETILKRMNQSTRYKARLAPKKEVEVRQGSLADVDRFNALMAVTGTRDSFGVHDPAYYRRAYELFAADGHGALILASYQNQDLAGVMVFRHGTQAYYLYGASSDVERNRMAPFIAQWEAIRWARTQGALTYDFWGIPDHDETILEAGFENRRDGLWGVYGFKRGWGGHIRRSVGAWDRVYSQPIYALYRHLIERRSAASA